jgi:hypothetical protein
LGSEIEKIGEVTFAQAAGQVYNRETHGKLRKAVQDVKSKSNHTGISKYMGSRTRGKARRKIYEIKAMRDTGPKTRTKNETQSLIMEGGQKRETRGKL